MQTSQQAGNTEKILLKVTQLKQYFPIKGGIFGQVVNHVKAVDDISFSVYEGETLGIVGESGCGKSTTGRAILRLDEPSGGQVYFQNRNLLQLNKREMRKIRKDLQIIFQDPFASLNPRQTIGQILNEALTIQNVLSEEKRPQRIVELLENVGLKADSIDRYPHEFSGGQRQRIGIARALAVEPKLIICDEAVSALDVSTQAQVLNLLKALQEKFKLTYLFISHNLGVVRHVSDRVMVMYLGKIVEIAANKSIFDHPQHPYTKALLSAIPVLNQVHRKDRIILKGDVPSPINPPAGCRFHTRCPLVTAKCRTEVPELRAIDNNHQVACHLVP